ncbi:unnamed protein product [Adineta ricciae]|uniref:Uncharacterized protein n=1 Tax=Adineta ricciae TaxID=249248 RepID=A0A815YG30_ADIRI|nr:unnamed protein product [Adineta ricciae]
MSGSFRAKNDKQPIERRSSIRLRHRTDDDDEGAAWSIGSNGGLSRSSQDDGLNFQNFSVHSEHIDRFSDKKLDREEYFQLIQNKNGEYSYDGIEEILPDSDDERMDDDERLYTNDDRSSFTREQFIEYQQLIKLLRFVKNGGRCTTILSLALLHDHNLHDRSAFFAFKDTSTINVLLNFLEMFDRDLKLNTLYVLENACQNPSFAYEVFHLGGIMTMIDSMCLDHFGIQESCSILIHILQFRRARRVIRRSGGISKLITLLDELSDNFTEKNIFDVFLLLCKSKKNQFVCIRYGIGRILLKIISYHSTISIISLLAILLQISIFRMQIIDKDLIISLVNLIDMTNTDLTRVICESLYYLSSDSSLLQFIYQYGFKKLKDLLEQTTDSSIFCSIINILTEFIRTNENLSSDIVSNIIKFLRNSSNSSYLLRIIQSLNQLTKHSQTIQIFKHENLFRDFIFYLQTITNPDILSNILSILQQCGKDKQATMMIVDNHGFEELWTLFKLASLPIQIASGWTIQNCLVSLENHGELIRSFDGIFYLILQTLSTESIDLLGVTLSIIAEIVKDEYNLEILTDLGIDNSQLSKPFCDALANLSDLPRNQKQFGSRRVILALKSYFKQQNSQLFRPLTKAIYDLSLIPSNCVLLHDVGIASELLRLIGDDDPIVQEKAANALRNMRQLLDDNRQVERTLNKEINRTSTQKLIDKREKCLLMSQ